MQVKRFVIDWGFRTLGLTGVPWLVAPYTQGFGAILMMHHVRPWHGRSYAPNRELEITPEFSMRPANDPRQRLDRRLDG